MHFDLELRLNLNMETLTWELKPQSDVTVHATEHNGFTFTSHIVVIGSRTIDAFVVNRSDP